MAPAHPHLTLEAVYPALWKSRPVNPALPVRHAFLGIEELLSYKSFSEVIEVISEEKNVITDVTWVSVYEIFSFKADKTTMAEPAMTWGFFSSRDCFSQCGKSIE